VWPKVPLELAGVAVTVVLVVMVFNPFTMKNVPHEVLQEPLALRPELTEQAPVLREADAEAEETSRTGDLNAGRQEDSRATRSAPKPAKPAKPRAAPAPAPVPPPPAASGGGAGGFAPEPPSLVAASRAEDLVDKKAEYAAAPASPPAPQPLASAAPAGEPLSEADVYSKDDVALERRKLQKETEAVSVMTLAIDDRTVDRDGVVDGRRTGSRARDEAAGAAKSSAESPGAGYASVEEKAFAQVEAVVKRHGGTIKLRSRMESPKPQRTYVVVLPSSVLDTVREEFKALGLLKDLDLNLDAASAEKVTFRLGVTVE
jgi:hypothetical protein